MVWRFGTLRLWLYWLNLSVEFGEICKLATLCNGLFRLDQFFDDFFYSTWSFFGHLMHLDTYSLGYSWHFAIYSLGHFKDKLNHSCTWLIITWPLISFRKLFTWPLFALGLHFYLANYWTWTLSLSTLFRLDQNILVTSFGQKSFLIQMKIVAK